MVENGNRQDCKKQKKAHLPTKFQVRLKLKQDTSMYAHVYMQACIKYLVQKWIIIDLREGFTFYSVKGK